MKLGFVADCHLGNPKRHGGPLVGGLNVRCRQSLVVFQRAVCLAASRGYAALTVAGDLFDEDRPEAPLLAAVAGAICEGSQPMEIVLLVGNHDQHSLDQGDHALAPLEYAGAQLVERPAVIHIEQAGSKPVAMACIPYRPEQAEDWLGKEIRTLAKASPLDVAVVHLGISDAQTAHYLKGARDSIDVDVLANILTRAGVRTCIAGNWHDHAMWPSADGKSPDIVQCGALVPTGWDNPGLDGYGTLVTLDTEKPRGENITLEFLPGPRFVKLDGNQQRALQVCQRAKSEGHALYVQAVVPANLAAETNRVWKGAKDAGEVAAVEVLADRNEAYQEARTAAAGAREAGTLDEALASYIASMTVEDGVDRGRVLEWARSYIKRARS